MRQRERNRESKARDQELDEPIRAEQRVRRANIAPVGPPADEIASGAQTQHEQSDDEGCGVDGRAENVAELTDPDHLVDETARAGTEEQEVEKNRGHDDGSDLSGGSGLKARRHSALRALSLQATQRLPDIKREADFEQSRIRD